jgi:predicted PurR-regulated permease PerM
VSDGGARRKGWAGVPWTILIAAIGALAVLWFLRTALAPFFVAIVAAYLMEPLYSRLARRMARGWAALCALLAFTLLLGLLVWAFVPPLVSQVERLIASMPSLQEKVIQRWTPWFSAHPQVTARLRQAMEGLNAMDFIKGLQDAGLGLVGWVLEVLTLIMVPLIIYYLLVEGPGLSRGLDGLIPVRYRERVRALAGEVNQRLGGYIRGQLAVVLVMAFLQGLAMKILGVPYAWVLGLLAGISNVVPYTSYFTALPLALLFSGVDGASGYHLLLTALVFVVVQKAEAFYFTPVWVGRASGLHPLEVLLGLFSFGFAFGIFGLVFAVPLMIFAKIIGRVLIAQYKSHPWYLGT